MQFHWLLHELACGWLLVPPILEHPAWNGTPGDGTRFAFILRGEGGCQVVVVPDCPEVHRFLLDRQLAVVALPLHRSETPPEI